MNLIPTKPEPPTIDPFERYYGTLQEIRHSIIFYGAAFWDTQRRRPIGQDYVTMMVDAAERLAREVQRQRGEIEQLQQRVAQLEKVNARHGMTAI